MNQRVAPCPLEPRAAAAVWHDDRLLVWVSSQHVQGIKPGIAATAGVEADAVRVMTPDVGGGFGAKIGVYSEELLRRQARPRASAGRSASARRAASR